MAGMKIGTCACGVALSIVIALGSGMAKAAEWHVSPTGTPAGDGSVAKPWDLQTALRQPEAVKPGDTIWLHGGTYDGAFTSTLKGADDKPVIVRQALGEHAILDAGDRREMALSIAEGGGNAWYWGFEILNSAKTYATGAEGRITRSSAVYVRAPRIKLVNLVLHDTGMGCGFWAEAPDSEMYGCLSYFNGYSNLDHGLYTQNETGKKRIADNILFCNASYGIHCYATAGFLNNFTFEGNIAFNNGGLYRDTYGCNIILGAAEKVAENDTLIGNYTYFSPRVPKAKGSNVFGYSAGCDNLVLRGNYFITESDRAVWFRNCKIAEMKDNVFYGRVAEPIPGVEAQFGDFDISKYPDNTYHNATNKPTGVWTFVRPNEYEKGRANIVIYNWDMKDAVEVDLAKSGLAVGEKYEIRDAQNYTGDPVLTGTYDGKPVTLPMAGLKMAETMAKVEFPPIHTDKEFNVFVVLPK